MIIYKFFIFNQIILLIKMYWLARISERNAAERRGLTLEDYRKFRDSERLLKNQKKALRERKKKIKEQTNIILIKSNCSI